MKARKSAFREIGLENDYLATMVDLPSGSAMDTTRRPESHKSTRQPPGPDSSVNANGTSTTTPAAAFASLPRFVLIVFLIAIVVPALTHRADTNAPLSGADAGPVHKSELVERRASIVQRADSPTDTCTRWSHQGAVVNGTLYIFGGQSKTSSSQTTNTWNNNFLTLNLATTWPIGSPAFTGLAQPEGPPAVANGYLWNSYTSLFLYGGLFSDSPPASPLPVSTWEYQIGSSTWIEHKGPITTPGNHSDPGGIPVQRSAEGAGLSVPSLGLSWYFGGHQDLYTTEGWSNQIARIYLRSLLEFTHPGFTNTGVQGLNQGSNVANDGGVYRNITEGGLQTQAGFTERADGVIVYVPGWGKNGILLGLSGGTNETFTEMNIIDIYDIATSTWYKQATSGPSPPIRVNPCAVVFEAPDASSFNVYLYGGQNLVPYAQQNQYSDLWILTIPSFTWIPVNLTGQSQPPARAGHTCHAWDGQMVVVGGYVGRDISCDSPGIYVFNGTSLQWQTTFTALSAADSSNTQSSGSGGAGLSGSYSYQVPAVVQQVIGGNSNGGATVTAPASGPATDGPLATGRPPISTVTQTHSGSAITQTATQTTQQTVTGLPSAPNPESTGSQPNPVGSNVAAIVAGVIAGLLALLAAYLAFCAWLYRRQLQLYKNHVAVAQRATQARYQSPESRAAWAHDKMQTGAFGTKIGPQQSHTSASESENISSLRQDDSGRESGSGSGSANGSGTGRINTIPAIYQSGGRSYKALGGTDTQYMGAGDEKDGPGSVTTNSSLENLLSGHEPSFFSIIMSPRRTLRVINRD